MFMLLLPFAFAIAAAIAYEKGGSSWVWGALVLSMVGAFMLGGGLFSVALFAIPFFVVAVSINGSPRTGDPFANVMRASFAASITMVLMFVLMLFLAKFIRLPF